MCKEQLKLIVPVMSPGVNQALETAAPILLHAAGSHKLSCSRERQICLADCRLWQLAFKAQVVNSMWHF